ncbi:MAG: GNAT family N-acetyltransferase, partial [Vicinamibacteraceae bacterium]
MSGTSIEPLTPALAEALGMHAMTFPRYRRLLSLERMVRDPSDGDKRLVQPVGVVAREERTVLGLVLAEQKVEDQQWSEMLSVYVSPHARNRGLGTRLVEALEDR